MKNTVPNCCRKLAEVLSAFTDSNRFHFIQIRDWCSATYNGYQVELTLILNGENVMARAQDLKIKLPDHEFSCGRYIVADCIVTAIGAAKDGQVEVQIEALLIEE